jgi:hypothetical protein
MKLVAVPHSYLYRQNLSARLFSSPCRVGRPGLSSRDFNSSMVAKLSDKLKPAARVSGQRQDVW